VRAERWRVLYNTIRLHSSLANAPGARDLADNELGVHGAGAPRSSRLPTPHTGNYVNSEVAALR
jgi:hypothetical protein